MSWGALLSSTVKSCCCRLATGSPDFGATTTSSEIPPLPACTEGFVCCADAEPVHNKTRTIKGLRPFMMNMRTTPRVWGPVGNLVGTLTPIGCYVEPVGWESILQGMSLAV